MQPLLYNRNIRLMVTGLLLLPIIILCVLYLDIPLALFVKNHLYANPAWSRTTANLPDLLLMVVLLSMFGSCCLYLVRSRKGIYDQLTSLAKHVLWVAPASFLVKTGLKLAFGRGNTRYWLLDPGLNGFHWFQMKDHCDGFPSGHMLVIVALLAALWRFYPKTRPLGILVSILLGVALIATNYHFLSDVIAGAYFGIAVEFVVYRQLFGQPWQPPVQNP